VIAIRPGFVLALLGALALSACGGGDGNGNNGGGGSDQAAASVGAVSSCAAKAGFDVSNTGYDKDIGETGQISLNKPGNTITISFFGEESVAGQYLDAIGGEGPNEGPEPGGNEQVGNAVIAYYAKGADLTKIQNCVSG
jgi:hypothetical protein